MKTWFELTGKEKAKRSIWGAVLSLLTAAAMTGGSMMYDLQADAVKERCTDIVPGKVYYADTTTRHQAGRTISAFYFIDGERYTARGQDDASEYRVNDAIIVHYNPENVVEAYAGDNVVKADPMLYVFSIIIGFFAPAFLVQAAIVSRKESKNGSLIR